MDMPKFIWVAELSHLDVYLQNRSNGVIILDATGAVDFSAAKLIYYPGYLNAQSDKDIKCDLGTFDAYRNNLKGSWSQWKC